MTYRESPEAADTDTSTTGSSTLANILSEEVTLSLLGHDGSFDQTPEYQWRDGSPNCRYKKNHSGTGVFAATTLPLWSISLMGRRKELQFWLATLHHHAGVASASAERAEKSITLEPVDYTTMVCIYGWRSIDKNMPFKKDALFKKMAGEEGVAFVLNCA